MAEEPEINLSEKFPDMTPIRGTPSLFTLNGCGVTLTGRRDFDAETGTYVKTRSLCAIFIPLIPIDAYRVADARGGGWYFAGKVPLSGFCKIWNLCILGMILLAVGSSYLNSYYRSSEYVNGQLLSEARSLRADGKSEEALKKFEAVFHSGTNHAGTAQAEAQELFNERMDQCAAAEAKGLLEYLAARRAGPRQLVPNQAVAQSADGVVTRLKDQDPLGAFEIHRQARAFLDAPPDPDPEYESLLAAARAAHPENVDLATEAAANFEKHEQLDQAKAVLEPLAGKLGATEGARILGQIYAREDQHEKAFALLEPYAQQRLTALHAAEDAYAKSAQASNDRAVGELNRKLNTDPWVLQYQSKDKAGQEQMVNDYVLERMKVDPALKSDQEKLAKAAEIVPVALDLGIIRLFRGREMKDPEAKKKELEAAEKVFLSIRNVAGETDSYRMYYAQVLFWLGKHEEGKKVFDELLASKNRDHLTLLGVGRTLREVGVHSEANALFEEAYGKAAKEEEKAQAAEMRALSPDSASDSVLWLERSNKNLPYVAARLESAKASQALVEGDRQGAAQHLRAAVAAWEKLPVNESSLNGLALTNLSLFQTTGDGSNCRAAADQLRRAVALNPGDSILASNAAYAITSVAVLDVVGDRFRFEYGSVDLEWPLVRYLIRTKEDDAAVRQKMKDSAALAEVTALYKKAMLLAPRNKGSYKELDRVYAYLRDLAAQKDLLRALENVELDLAKETQDLRAYQDGTNDLEILKQAATSIAHLRTALESVPKDAQPLTWAATACALADRRLIPHNLGKPANLDEIHALVQQAHALQPSLATREHLWNALILRACERLAGQHPAFKRACDEAGRNLGAAIMLPLLVKQDDTLRAAALKDPDLKAMRDLLREIRAEFPDRVSAWEWALSKGLGLEEADAIAQAIRDQPAALLSQQIDERLSPTSPAVALSGLWLRTLLGREAEGKAVYEAFRARGVKLPEQP